MKSRSLSFPKKVLSTSVAWSSFLLVLVASVQLRAQYSQLSCNTITPVVNVTATNATTPGDFNNLTVTSSQTAFVDEFSSKSNLIDADLTNGATSLVPGAWIQVKDNSATGTSIYPAGTFAGFAVSRLSVSGSITITTYKGTDELESKTINNNFFPGLATSITKVGFVTTKDFDRVRLTLTGASISLVTVYYPIVERLCTNNTGLTCNTKTPIASPSFPVSSTNVGFPAVINSDRTETSGLTAARIDDADRVVDSDQTNYATISTIGSIAGSVSISVRDQLSTDYPSGTFAGFDIETTQLAGLGLLNNITLRTYINGGATAVQTVSGSSLFVSASLLNTSGRQTVGFVTTAPFDEIQITFNQTATVSLGTTRVYSAIFRSFCEGPTLVCNTSTLLNESTQPVLIDVNNTGTAGVACVNCTVSNASNAIDGDATTAASVSLAAGAGTTASLAIKKQLSTYPANTFAGFDIENPVLAGTNLLSGITVQTLLDGVVLQTVTTNTGLVSLNASILSGTGRQTVGFVATSAFNGLKITLTNGGSLNLGETRIYSAIVKSFCVGTPFVCSVIKPITNSNYPVYVNSKNTGIGSLGCAGCSINNSENVIDSLATAPATVVLGAGVASNATFSVANAIDTYPAETFAGFDIESNTLLGVNLAGRTTITLYNNGAVVQSGTGTSLLAGATLSTGNRQIVGTVAQVPFDEIQIEFTQLGGANLGTINIYRAVVQKSCVTTVACNQTRYLNTPEFSAVIEGTRTGFSGAAGVGDNYIRDPWNVVSASTTDFARIRNVAGAGVAASISVADPADVYPAGTFAGFTINKGQFLVSADLNASITVTTYLNGIQQESNSGGNLLNLSVFVQIFGTPSGLYNVGFVASKPFDEIQLSVGSLVSALDQFVDVYGAFIDTRTSSNGGTLVCNFVANPDFNVTIKNVPVSGNVSTNDRIASGATYGTPEAAAGNPSGSTITLNSDGTYNFVATTPGSYTYTVPVCPASQTACLATPLIITVLDPSVITNPPVVNLDYATTNAGTPVTVNVTANDRPGNPGGTLNTSTVVIQPAHGSAAIDGNGNVVYTPSTGYVGDDLLTYQACENPGGLCKTATVTIHIVTPGSSTVTAVDDYTKTRINESVSGNVLSNDQGGSLTVSNAVPNTVTITAPGKGTLVLGSDGTYTFSPSTGVTGPVDFTYTACNNGTVCSTATLHLLVLPATDLIQLIYARPNIIYGNTPITVVVDVLELKGVATNGQITVRITRDPLFSLSFSPNATNVGGRTVQNSVWNFDDMNDPAYYILTTNQTITGGGTISFGLEGSMNPDGTTGNLTISSVIEGGSGGELKVNNNTDADKIDYFQQ